MTGRQRKGAAASVLTAVALAALVLWLGSRKAPGGSIDAVGATTDVAVQPIAGGADQAAALQAALDSLQPGQRLVLAPGNYRVGNVLAIRGEQVVVSGYGATLTATSPDAQAVEITGRNATLVGVTLVGTGTQRLESSTSAKVSVDGYGIQVLDVTIRGGASAGIFVSRGNSIALVGNKVNGTLADGIHITGGSRDVLVQDNSVTATGDDMIGIVSYQRDGTINQNILVSANYLAGNAWGRGASIVGGTDVTLANNWIEGVQKAAAVLIAQEDGYRTAGVTNVQVTDNMISDIENATRPGNNRLAAGHAAIDINTGTGSVARVLVAGNQVTRATYDGFRAVGNVCNVRVSRNRFVTIGGAALSLQVRNCPTDAWTCDGNTLDGTGIALTGCNGTGAPQVSGADRTRLPQVRTALRQQ